jgi:RNA polymerase sigma-70 factor (ECF subfamily)
MSRTPGNVIAAFEAGRARWPGVEVPLDRFAAHVEGLQVDDDDLRLRGTDLFLAAACAAGDVAALRHFDTAFVSSVDGRVARFQLSADKVDELRQKLRTKLFVGLSPGIRRYQGRAPLAAWLHVTAVRVAIDIAALAPRAATDVDLFELVGDDQTPEIETARRQHEERFRLALEESFRQLSARDKTILRLHVVDGLNIDAIGAIYGVHRATAARWLVAIRARVYDGLKQQFVMQWNASSSELRSLVWLLRDHIHLTAKRVLES